MAVDFLDEDGGNVPKKTKKGSTTPILDTFSRDLVKLANEGKIDPIVGRENEVKRICQILTRKTKRNVLVCSNPGVGKCIGGDTKVTIRNNRTNKVMEISVNELVNTLPNT